MDKLAIFDIDYTITKKETLLQLFLYLLKDDIKNIRYIPRAIISGLLYAISFFDERKVKESFLKFLYNKNESEVYIVAKRFYKDRLSKILYQDAIEMIKKLKNQGYKVYLISASPEFYMFQFYSIKEVDKIIGTKFKFENGKFICRMEGLNCKGNEKVRRLKEELKKEGNNINFEDSYMFSDSLSDKPLLDLVGKPYLINYKKTSKYNILKWEWVKEETLKW